MAVWRGQYDGNSYVGLYAKASDQLCIVPRGAPEKFLRGASALGAPLLRASIDGSPYVGLYLAMNSNGILAPSFLSAEERQELEGSGLKVGILRDSRFSALGNNVACNDRGALLNPGMHHEDVKLAEKILGVPVRQATVAGYHTPGSCLVATNKGWLAHNRITPDEGAMLEELFGSPGLNGTTNMGSAFVGIGAVANSKGLIVGESSSGFEESRITQALDLVG
ncbi:Translation initiation factor 6 [uncultured archaeon]|nr:Translation initiation factor 6 [uncultured archaeon]